MDVQCKGVSQNRKAPLGNYFAAGVICNILCYEARLCSTFGRRSPLRNVPHVSKRKRLALSRHGLCTGTGDTIEERAATFSKALWQAIANVQVILWLDNFNKQRFGPNNFKLDKSLDTTALAILHNTELPLFGGQPTLLNLANNVDGVAAGLLAQLEAMVRCAEQELT